MVASRWGEGLEFLMLKWRAQACLVFGLRQRALAIFEQMLARWPASDYVLSSRGALHAETGHTVAAVADFRAVVTARPERASGWFNLGFLLEQQGELDEAAAAFERTVALDPKLDRAWYGLGLVRIRQRRLDDAAAALKRNTELQPMSPYGWYQLARVHVDRNEPDEAARIIRHLKGFEPKIAAQLVRETGLGGDT